MPYFHVVFTLPQDIGPLALNNKRLVYAILFRAASETLLTLAADPKHLGARIGFLMVLHTWGQNLHHHPHVHCVVPGGGLSADRTQWVACLDHFFLPVRVLSTLFRGKFIAFLQEAFDQGKLSFGGRLKELARASSWKNWLKKLRSIDWVVYAKPPFGGPQQVLKYLARYTHRVAISNQRLLSLDDGKVSFRWKDYAQNNRQRTMTLDALEFIRRFLLHVLPTGFVRIRYYGFLANNQRKAQLPRIRQLLGDPTGLNPSTAEAPDAHSFSTANDDQELCPQCKQGRMVLIEAIPPRTDTASQPCWPDTS